METRRPILIVEDDPKLGPRICSIVRSRAPAFLVATAKEAQSALDGGALGGAIVDILLPDGSGLDVVAEKRSEAPYLPILLMTGVCEPAVVNRAYDLGLDYVCKPVRVDQLLAFVSVVKLAESLREPTTMQLCASFATRHQLTEHQARVVALSVVGRSREELATELGISENTLKKEITAILLRSGEKTLEAIARRIRQEHFGSLCPTSE